MRAIVVSMYITPLTLSLQTFWTAHFLSYFLVLTIQGLVLAIFLFATSGNLTNNSSCSLFIFFYLLYAAQTVLFCLFICTLISQ